MIRLPLIAALLLITPGCAAVPAVGYVTPAITSYVAPLGMDAMRTRIVTDPQDEQRDQELAQLKLQLDELQQEVAVLRGPRQLLPVEQLRQLDTLARDRRANRRAFGS